MQTIQEVLDHALVKLSWLSLNFGPISIDQVQFGERLIVIIQCTVGEHSFTGSNLSDTIESAHDFLKGL